MSGCIFAWVRNDICQQWAHIQHIWAKPLYNWWSCQWRTDHPPRQQSLCSRLQTKIFAMITCCNIKLIYLLKYSYQCSPWYCRWNYNKIMWNIPTSRHSTSLTQRQKDWAGRRKVRSESFLQCLSNHGILSQWQCSPKTGWWTRCSSKKTRSRTPSICGDLPDHRGVIEDEYFENGDDEDD